MDNVLEWGETPFDLMSKKELMLAAQKMYDALTTAKGVLRILEAGDSSGFWGKEGYGGSALEKCRQVIEPIEQRFGSEQIYRVFYRYAGDLLWENTGYSMLRTDWHICPKCGQLVGSSVVLNSIPKKCGNLLFGAAGCVGKMRPIKWSDLKKMPAIAEDE